jgi:hypothetical protein
LFVASVDRASTTPDWAGVAASDEVNPFNRGEFNPPCISVFSGLRPMVVEHMETGTIILDLPPAHHPGPLQAKVKAAATREEAAEGHDRPPVKAFLPSAPPQSPV